MTYQDIYKKFMIEYDKATATTSYPSLTTEELAAILDKAYLALIGLKFTGNNIRRSIFESDIKSVSDLNTLVCFGDVSSPSFPGIIPNECKFYLDTLDPKFLYFVSGILRWVIDGQQQIIPMTLVSHKQAEKFFETFVNKPWIKYPICYFEEDLISDRCDVLNVVIDSKLAETWNESSIPLEDIHLDLKYIQVPISFKGKANNNTDHIEINDQMVEELISLAVTFALENVEAPRLKTKIQTKGLES